MDLQKETGLLRWEYRLKGFFEKIGRGWSRDAVTNNFWLEIERFQGYDWPWNYLSAELDTAVDIIT